MADNTAVKNASGSTINAATDELGDGSFSPKVTLLLGDSTTTQIAPAVSLADDAAFTPATSRVNPAGFFCDESATDSVDEGDIGVARMTADRKVWTKTTIDQTTPGTTDRVTTGGVTLVDVTLTLDTSAYASGDLIAETQAVASAVRVNDGFGILHSLMVVDEDDQKAAIDIYFLSANNSFGSENSAPSISDASARDILGVVSVAAADYKDLGGVSIAMKTGLNMIVKGASGSTSIYVAVVSNASTPTYTASGVKLRVGIIQQ